MPTAIPITVRSLSLRNSAARAVELLEARTMLSVAINSQGWTVVTPPVGTRIIYCSTSTGTDTNSGMSPNFPVQSLARAESLLQNHTGDQLLLKAGDVFYGNFIFWTLSGASAENPMVLGSYGTGARPEIMTGTQDGLETGKVSAPEVDNLDILGINFCANARDPNLTSNPATKTNPAGIQFLTQSSNITVENCQFEYYSVDINFQDYLGPINNVTVRRNIITDAYATNAHAQGLYATGVHNLTIQGNDFDQNGYNLAAGAQPTVFNQDCYLAYDNTNCVVTDNIFARAAATGLEDRPGGIVEDNTFIDDPVGLTFGLVNGAKTTVGGVTGAVEGNVFIGGGNTGNFPEGQAVEIGNIRSAGAVVSNNVFTQGGDNSAPAITLCCGKSQIDPQNSVGINNLTIETNVFYDWSTGIDVVHGLTPGGTGLTAFNNVNILNNQFENLTGPSVENHVGSYLSQEHFSGNTYYHAGQWIVNSERAKTVGSTLTHAMSFPDPNRSVATYDKAIGASGTIGDFLARAAAQTPSNFNLSLSGSSLAGYIDQGFAISGSPVVINPVPGGGGSGSTTGGTSSGGSGSGSGGTSGGTSGGSRSALGVFQAVQFDYANGVKVQSGDLGSADNGDWAEYKQIDFGTGVNEFNAYIAGVKGYAGEIQLRLDSPTGALAGTLNVEATGSWDAYTLQSTKISGATGIHNLYLVFVGKYGIANVKSFSFASSVTKGPTPSARAATSTFEALDYSSHSGVANDHYDGISGNGGNWAEYASVDFGTGVKTFKAEIAALARYAGHIDIHLDSPTGTMIGSLRVKGTGAWDKTALQTTAVAKVTGVHNLYLVFIGGKAVGNLLSFSFE